MRRRQPPVVVVVPAVGRAARRCRRARPVPSALRRGWPRPRSSGRCPWPPPAPRRPPTSGTRKTLAPVRMTAIVFCFRPPIGPTVPLGSIVPVAATSTPPVRSPGVSVSSSDSVKARPADGPPIWPESICTSNGNWNLIVSGGDGFGTKPMMARPSFDAISCVGCGHLLVAALEGEVHRVTDLLAGEGLGEVRDDVDGCRVDGRDDVLRVEDRRHRRLLRARAALVLGQAEAVDHDAAVGHGHVVAQPGQRDVGGEVLRIGHELQVLLAVLLLALVAEDLLFGVDVDLLRVELADQPPEGRQARRADGDEQHLPVDGIRLGALDVDPRRRRPGVTRCVGDIGNPDVGRADHADRQHAPPAR